MIAEELQKAGFCIEPDARHAGSYRWDQQVGIFKPLAEDPILPTPLYNGAANLLRLCVIIAAADGRVDQRELAVFRHIIENQLHFTQTEAKRLSVLESLLAANVEEAQKTLNRIAKQIPQDKRLLIAKVLVKVAAVDHAITKREWRMLGKVFKLLHLPEQTLNALTEEFRESDLTDQQASYQKEGGPTPQPAKEFKLDMEKVYAITDETKEVVGILAVVMADEEPSPPSPPVEKPATELDAAHPGDARPASALRTGPSAFTGLDSTLHPVLERLLTKTSWTRSEFNALADECHLMPLSLYDTLNEWADSALGDLLLEGEDPIRVHTNLISKETTHDGHQTSRT
jgi:uncharacterized tellurite resistance protein B-like protein